jgi:uncharacterized repeat protein (TIGR01451 family)
MVLIRRTSGDGVSLNPGKAVLCALAGLLLMVATGVQARGVSTGTVLTNANSINQTNNFFTSTNAGNLSATYSNASGQRKYAFVNGPSALVTVTNAHDLSPWHAVSSHTQQVTAGSVVTFSNAITNWGNMSDDIRIVISNRAASAGWIAADTFQIGTNTGSSFNVMANLNPDVAYSLGFSVKVPSSMPAGSTNRFYMRLVNSAGESGAGDSWPGPGAIAPATTDMGAVQRDNQVIEFLIVVKGPFLRLSKFVDFTATRPYQELTYTIFVTNRGNAPAKGVVVQDVIPDNSTNVANTLEWASNSAAYSPMIDVGGGDQAEVVNISGRPAVRGTWSDLAPGAYGSLRFRVRVK